MRGTVSTNRRTNRILLDGKPAFELETVLFLRVGEGLRRGWIMEEGRVVGRIEVRMERGW
jgi:hypothetical protein